MKSTLLAALCAAACAQLSLAQAVPPTILELDLENYVSYLGDVGDPLRFATDANMMTPAGPVRNFYRALQIADIVAVNNRPATGAFSSAVIGVLALRPAPSAGFAIADTMRNTASVITIEILKADGTPIGTIMATGLQSGVAPPGSPSAAAGHAQGHNLAIIGGTGAFLGVRGQLAGAPAQPGKALIRSASMTEDPVNRRRHGGGTWRWIAHLIPMTRPEITMLPSGPAIAHSSDFAPVSAAKPAAPGEILSLVATGLGPVSPVVDLGKPFPANPLAAVNSPVEVTVNGKAAEVLGAVGYPGSVDSYQVNFRVPPDTERGLASIQLSAAWISGTPVSIRVQ